MNAPTHYDIIGDIHGRYDKLATLMERLGYQPAAVGFIPPAGHRALFLGDLIDTKPGHPFPGGVRATLRAVKAMCDRGHALCLMGNHEWNAILFHSAGPDGEPLKENSLQEQVDCEFPAEISYEVGQLMPMGGDDEDEEQ